jgi:acetyl-CoA carboxylase biotin carboxyl carrier protein
VDVEKVKEFIKLLEGSDLKKMTIREKDSELVLEKEDTYQPMPTHVSLPSQHFTPPPASQQPVVSSSEEKKVENGSFVTSPLVGTFYRKPAPDQQSFVQNGDRVEADTVVCIIEAMKVMNEVKAGVAGVIDEILVEDAHPVEYGTKMFRII